jgi:sugar lactone lactonase YvrE
MANPLRPEQAPEVSNGDRGSRPVLLVFLLAAACGSASRTGAAPLTLAVSPPSVILASGEIVAVTVKAVRADSPGGPIELAFEGIPDGVAVDAPAIAAGATIAVVTLRNQCTGTSREGVPATVRGSTNGSNAAASFSITIRCSAGDDLSLEILAGAPGGSGNADDQGSQARFLDPFSIVGDGAGNLFIADTFNNTIRKVEIASGIVTTFAGSRIVGFSDGTGADAKFTTPFGIARDGDKLYVADTGNHVIRAIDLRSASVTTIAGVAGRPGAVDGPADTARFNDPAGIAAVAGKLFVADTGNDTIRQIDLATAAVTTLAGAPGEEGSADGIGGAARFFGPLGIAADGGGNLFVADSFNHTIRRIEIASAAVTTLAGEAGQPGTAGGVGTARFDFPTGIASDGAGGLYVADTVNLQIRLVSVADGDVVTVAGVTSPSCQLDRPNRLCFPHGVAVEQGTVYVADTAAHRIRVLSEDGVGALAGLASSAGSEDGSHAGARFNGPFLLASDGADAIYVADSANNTIRRISISSGAVTTVAGAPDLPCCSDGIGTQASFSNPEAVAVDGDALYVADTVGETIRKIVISTREVTTIAGAVGETGLTDGIGAEARFLFPAGVVADGQGHLYVSDFFAIRKIDLATRAVTTLALSFADGQPQFAFAPGLALDGNGNLYVADTTSDVIRKIELATNVVTTLAGAVNVPGVADGIGSDARFDRPLGVAFDGVNALYVTDFGNALVRKINLGTGAVTAVIGEPGIAGVRTGALPGRLNAPAGIAVLGPGRLAISDRAENVVLTAVVAP